MIKLKSLIDTNLLKLKKDIGWARGEAPPRQWINWMAYMTNAWLEYLEDRLDKPIHYATESDLPPPAEAEGWIGYLDSEDALVISNGNVWLKIRTQNI